MSDSQSSLNPIAIQAMIHSYHINPPPSPLPVVILAQFDLFFWASYIPVGQPLLILVYRFLRCLLTQAVCAVKDTNLLVTAAALLPIMLFCYVN